MANIATDTPTDRPSFVQDLGAPPKPRHIVAPEDAPEIPDGVLPEGVEAGDLYLVAQARTVGEFLHRTVGNCMDIFEKKTENARNHCVGCRIKVGKDMTEAKIVDDVYFHAARCRSRSVVFQFRFVFVDGTSVIAERFPRRR